MDCVVEEGKASGDSHKVSRVEEEEEDRDSDSDSDDDMYFDPPGCPLDGSDVSPVREDGTRWIRVTDRERTRQQDTHHMALGKAFCNVCKMMTGHLTHKCPYRCELIFRNARCFKKVHLDDEDHSYLLTPVDCAECDEMKDGGVCDEHSFFFC